MGYLADNIGPHKIGDCPVLYPYEMIVEWGVNDPFAAPSAADVLSAKVKEVFPDVEDWQLSVLREDERRLKFRFRTESHRNQASNTLLALPPGSIFIKRVRFLNPPDSARRGIA